MKKRYLILGVIIVIVLTIYLTRDMEEGSALSSVCNGTLKKIKNENPKGFLKIYDRAKTETSGVLSAKCKISEDIKECVERQEEFLANMNCMAQFLKQSDLSEKEVKELRELAGK